MKSIKKATQATPVIAGATSVVALFAASSLDAGIIVSDLGATVSFDGVTSFSWDIDGDGGAELSIASNGSSSSSSSTATAIGIGNFSDGFEVRVHFSQLENLSKDVAVGTIHFATGPFAYLVYTSVLGSAYSNFDSLESGYIGFKFESASDTLYGWAEVILDAGSFQLVQWAYEDSGGDILVGDVGAIPEPAGAATGLGLLALGAAGLRRMRRPKSA